jgi:hypothetical protein
MPLQPACLAKCVAQYPKLRVIGLETAIRGVEKFSIRSDELKELSPAAHAAQAALLGPAPIVVLNDRDGVVGQVAEHLGVKSSTRSSTQRRAMASVVLPFALDVAPRRRCGCRIGLLAAQQSDFDARKFGSNHRSPQLRKTRHCWAPVFSRKPRPPYFRRRIAQRFSRFQATTAYMR